MTMRTLEENIERLEKATADAQAATREAHAATKDLRNVLKEAADLLEKRATELVEEHLGDLVRTELDKIVPEMTKQSRLIYERVGQQADKLVNIALGSEWSSRNGKEDLRPKLATKLREWIREELDHA